jgi:rubrerythrin
MDTELRSVRYLRKDNRMSIKGKQIGRLKNWVKRLEQMLEAEKQKVKGYEELAKVHSAYIAILLQRLKATEGKPVVISAEATTHALSNLEVRACVDETERAWKFYVEEIE